MPLAVERLMCVGFSAACSLAAPRLPEAPKGSEGLPAGHKDEPVSWWLGLQEIAMQSSFPSAPKGERRANGKVASPILSCGGFTGSKRKDILSRSE